MRTCASREGASGCWAEMVALSVKLALYGDRNISCGQTKGYLKKKKGGGQFGGLGTHRHMAV